MTLTEMLITTFLTSVLLFVLVGWMNRLQRQAKLDLAVRQLAQLDLALTHYFSAEAGYPRFDGPLAAAHAAEALAGVSKSRGVLELFPSVLWQDSPARVPVDPWGTPLRYRAAEDSPRVRANAGRPLFVSAGPDRLFGIDHPGAAGDDLRSDDPDPDDFFQALREAAISEEK